jgi:hypothetical protein
MSQSMVLVRTQMNVVYDQMTELGLDPGDFEWTVKTSELAPRAKISELRHRSSTAYLRFDWTNGGAYGSPVWVLERRPGAHEPTDLGEHPKPAIDDHLKTGHRARSRPGH